MNATHSIQVSLADKKSPLLGSIECTHSNDDESIRYSFCRLSPLNEIGDCLFGKEHAKKISKRKMFGLLVRAAGAYHIGTAGSWIYKEMRDRFELGSGETSDEEEKGTGSWNSEY